ncbi:sodium/hydrogen exchanger [Ignisphaera aggregans DSM 17230]|uniref:Sodium/hydrogen exchanger n=1 Tax=Ignisphaera aggregans (strain DSM 17230 / JCM 13409 / AQ1.S1) TaxID=583356 RepID=E0SR21_IGNAA|nr:sodium/hydrogen exchanger [Ignisphaera aggregans DSM 17230]
MFIMGETGFEWLIEIALLLVLAKSLELLMVRLGFLRVVAWLLAGLLVSIVRIYIGYEPSIVVKAFAYLGIILLLFEAGLEGSLRMFIRGFRRVGLIAIGGVIGAIASGFIAIPILHLSIYSGIALGIILSATSVSVTVKAFEELGVLSSLEAQAVIGAAVVDDVIGLALIGLLPTSKGVNILSIAILASLAFMLWFATAIVAEKALRGLFKKILTTPIEAGTEVTALILTLLLAYIATRIGLSTILLAYALGIGIASFRYIARRLGDRLRTLVVLFAPLFFVYAGYQLDIRELLAVELHKIAFAVAIVILLAFTSKILGCYIFARLSGFSHRQSLIVGVGMVPRAEVMTVIATSALDYGLIDQSIYLAILFIIPITTMVTPILIKKLYS